LAQRLRAGVVKLARSAKGVPRVVYLIPPSSSVCAAFGIEKTEKMRESLLAFVCYAPEK
jgi:hypothetical protein